VIFSIDAEKAFDKIQYPFMIKALMKVGIEEMYLYIIENIHNKSTANNILNVEKLKPCPLMSRMRQECSLSLLLVCVCVCVCVWY
jgi:hypothetical protein